MVKRRLADKPGYYKGRHYSEYLEEVGRLKRTGDMERARSLLLDLVEATESESRATGWGVPPWYYEQLAIIYRKAEDYDSEVAILERFAQQEHGPGVMLGRLMVRLQRARHLARARSQGAPGARGSRSE